MAETSAGHRLDAARKFLTRLLFRDESLDRLRMRPQTQSAYARFAGFMYLFVLLIDIAGVAIVSKVGGGGNFIDTAHQIAAQETLYRIGICCGLVGYLSTILLGAGLYVTVKPVDGNLALTALLFRLAESAIGGMVVVLGFATLQVYLDANRAGEFDANQLGALAELGARISAVPSGVGNVVSAIFFSVGSTIFFYLFLRAAYIPRILATWGVFASLLVGVAFIASLALPQSAGLLLGIGGAPIGIAELLTGLWLVSRGIQTRQQVTQAGVDP